MKCEKCNQNEAILHYAANINGEVTERHLCAECAKAEGFNMRQNDFFGIRSSNLFDQMFGRNLMDDSLFDGLFGGSIFSNFEQLMAPSITFPRIHITLHDGGYSTAAPGQSNGLSDEKIPQDAGEDIRRKRELNALRHQLDQAIQAEDYETCADLQKKIRELEQK